MADPFAEHLAIWDRLAEEDPFWAVLSDPAKRGGGWDPDAFFATGGEHVDRLENELQEIGHSFAGRRALDFGCGLGRLTQALARTASFAMGIDASVGMVVGAQRWNRSPERCAYLLNRSADLEMLPDRSFDAVISFIVFQHIPAPVSHRYLAELGRLVVPGGFLVVQIPAEEVVADLPTAAFGSHVRLLEGPARLAAGGRAEVVVEVVNTSGAPWRPRPSRRLRVGNHWVALDGGVSAYDDGRVVLDLLEPGETGVVRLPIEAPGAPGAYRIEVDVVVEGQGWFADRGGHAGSAELQVVPAPVGAASAAGGGAVADAVSFGMWGIARADVLRLLGDAGLRVLQVAPDGSCGEDWVSWRYLATRP